MTSSHLKMFFKLMLFIMIVAFFLYILFGTRILFLASLWQYLICLLWNNDWCFVYFDLSFFVIVDILSVLTWFVYGIFINLSMFITVRLVYLVIVICLFGYKFAMWYFFIHCDRWIGIFTPETPYEISIYLAIFCDVIKSDW